MTSWGEGVRVQRTKLGMTQSELARALDVSQGTISAWEKDLKVPPYREKVFGDIEALSTEASGAIAARPRLREGGEMNYRAIKPLGSQAIFDQVRNYVRENKIASHGRGIDVWLLGPTTLPVTQLDSEQSLGSLNLIVELISEYQADYHVIWDLDRMSVLPTSVLYGRVSPEETGRRLYLAFQALEDRLIEACDSAGTDWAKIKHIPVVRPLARAEKLPSDRLNEAKKYWSYLQAQTRQMNWQFNVFVDFPDFERLKVKEEVNVQQLMSLWNDDSSVVLYKPKDEVFTEEAPPHVWGFGDFALGPIANIRQADLGDHWKPGEAAVFSPFFWLPMDRVVRIIDLCETWRAVCMGDEELAGQLA